VVAQIRCALTQRCYRLPDRLPTGLIEVRLQREDRAHALVRCRRTALLCHSAFDPIVEAPEVGAASSLTHAPIEARRSVGSLAVPA